MNSATRASTRAFRPEILADHRCGFRQACRHAFVLCLAFVLILGRGPIDLPDLSGTAVFATLDPGISLADETANDDPDSPVTPAGEIGSRCNPVIPGAGIWNFAGLHLHAPRARGPPANPALN